MPDTKGLPILLAAMLISPLLLSPTHVLVSAQQEMIPQWTVDNPHPFTNLAVSADGKCMAVSTNQTNTLYMFHEDEVHWTAPVDSVSALAMAANGEYIAVGTKHQFYLFTQENPTPRISFQLDDDHALVAISANGNTTAVGGTALPYNDPNGTRLYLFKDDTPTPIWNTTLPGILESLSMTDDGAYFVASTSHPGRLYLFARDEATPVWVYPLGERSGGAKISHDGGYIVVVGGNQTNDTDLRIYQFQRQTAIPHYMKVISDLPSSAGVSISANGSLFAISYTASNSLVFFNLDLPPYGYGPGSVLKTTLPHRRVSMAMSSDGRHIIVGTVKGIFVYEYSDRQLHLSKHYTTSSPFIRDVASSANGQFIIAIATAHDNNEYSTIHLFDNFQGSHLTPLAPWVPLAILMITATAVSAATAYVLSRRHRREPHTTPTKRSDGK